MEKKKLDFTAAKSYIYDKDKTHGDMKEVKREMALTFIEPGPVVLVSTSDGSRNNVMTISWTMAMDFDGRIAIATGPWNHSFEALMRSGECVVNIPGDGMLRTAVEIGTVSGADTDKFEKFGLTALPAATVGAPLIGECMACLECRVEDYIRPYGIVVLHVERVVVNEAAAEQRMFHARGDGTFVIDGESVSLRSLMQEKLPPGL